jgi:hypothetical protein
MDKKVMTEGKSWQKPELVVLVRSKPEEAVLHGCKLLARVIAAPDALDGWCQWSPNQQLCNRKPCSAIEAS